MKRFTLGVFLMFVMLFCVMVGQMFASDIPEQAYLEYIENYIEGCNKIEMSIQQGGRLSYAESMNLRNELNSLLGFPDWAVNYGFRYKRIKIIKK